ncbi:MAG: tripartite tricarboxylate transporter TctB family protein [Aestuariivirgaceae bacterium]
MSTGGKPLGELFLGFALVLLGFLILAGTLSITIAPAYSRVGPRVFPFAVAAGMIVLGLLYAFESWKGAQTPPEDHAINFWPIVLISAGIILDALLMPSLGFILSSSILFLMVAAGFGSRRYLRDGLVGLALSAVAYVTFVHGLGLRLPAGPFTGWT